MKIQNKIVYLLISIFLVYTLLFSGFIYYSISNYAFTDFYKRLEIRAVTTAKIELEHPNDIGAIREIHQEYLERLPQQQEFFIEIPAMDSIDWKSFPFPEGVDRTFVKKILRDSAGTDRNDNIYYSGILYHSTTDNKDYIVIISAENYFNSHHIAYLRNLLISSLAYSLMLITMISFLFSRTVIQPINRIINEVKKISSENLHLRLKIPDQNDLLNSLTLTFNDMLDRLETSFETQKNFISNASHELNTPLTSIIGEADVALTKVRTIEEYIETIKIILEQAEKLEQKTKALLYLAQTGYSGKSMKSEIIRTDQLILDVKQTVESINPQARVILDFNLLPDIPEKLKIRGSGQLLHLAFSNIILNGVKYGNGHPVQVALGSDQKTIIVVIKDTGIGIPEGEIQYIFDPFFRASNTRNYEGYGIGLPLSRNIIKIHGGTLQINSQENQGTTVQILLPVAKLQ